MALTRGALGGNLSLICTQAIAAHAVAAGAHRALRALAGEQPSQLSMISRILICDDEPYLALALALKFKGAGFDVVTARDGLEAWEALQKQPPDLLITDCTMPRMDGLELCRRIRSDPKTRDLPIFMLSARNFELNGSAVVAELGIDRCMGKPFSPGELLRQVDQVLHGERRRVVVR